MAVVPRGLFLDKVLAFAKVELAAECDYLAEAAHQREFAALLADDPDVHVPAVVDALCTRTVLVTTLARGVHIDAAASTLPQHTRDQLARRLLRLTLRELFEFRSAPPLLFPPASRCGLAQRHPRQHVEMLTCACNCNPARTPRRWQRVTSQRTLSSAPPALSVAGGTPLKNSAAEGRNITLTRGRGRWIHAVTCRRIRTGPISCTMKPRTLSPCWTLAPRGGTTSRSSTSTCDSSWRPPVRRSTCQPTSVSRVVAVSWR